MDRGELMQKAGDLLRKYRWPILVLVIGVILMLLPSAEPHDSVTPAASQAEKPGMDQELAHILSQIQGAGEVRVLLTESSGVQTVYQTDVDGAQDRHEKTVIVTGADRSQAGLVQQVIPPKYMGAIVVCHGADNATVRLAIVEAVSKVTGLGADRISVLKMK
jgi:stage III sporulation protein AG